MKAVPYLFATLLLAGGCAKSPEEHAKEVVATSLRASPALATSYEPASLQVHPFPKEQVLHFSADQGTYRGGYLVTYQVRGVDGPTRQADFVTTTDSVSTFIPLRHADEFRQRYGVSY